METQNSFTAARPGTTLQESARVYRIKKELLKSALIFSATLGLITPILVAVLRLIMPPSSLNTFIFSIFALVGVIALGMAVGRYWALTAPELKISPTEIYYRDYGFVIKTAWANVAQIGSINTGQTRLSGLLLNAAVAPDTRINGILKTLFVLKPLIFILAVMSRSYFGAPNPNLTRVIPVAKFQSNWENNELGQQINQYAPWLFDPNFRPGEYPAVGSPWSARNWQTAPVEPVNIPPVWLVAAILTMVNLAVFGALYLLIDVA